MSDTARSAIPLPAASLTDSGFSVARSADRLHDAIDAVHRPCRQETLELLPQLGGDGPRTPSLVVLCARPESDDHDVVFVVEGGRDLTDRSLGELPSDEGRRERPDP